MTGDELKAARIALGLSKTALGRALNMGPNSRQAVHRWETGSTIPGPVQVAVQCLLTHGSE